ncbi:MAG TPA: hypothetical protein VGE52_17525 [Pirellulales bacterium]
MFVAGAGAVCYSTFFSVNFIHKAAIMRINQRTGGGTVGVAGMLFAAAMLGCSAPSDATPAGHDHSVKSEATRSPHAGHGGRAPQSEGHAHTLQVTTPGGRPSAERSLELQLKILGEDGKPLTDFEVVHEKPLHLILVRDGLDQFFHIHPSLDAHGVATATFTFPLGGKWRLFADHTARGHGEAAPTAVIDVSGDDPPAPALAPTHGRAQGDGLDADVGVAQSPDGREATLTFNLVGADGRPAVGMEPYLGAGGHLVVLSADGVQFIHTHPKEAGASARVEFAAHLPGPGLYKAWGQFKQGGEVRTIPVVFTIESQHP